MKNEPSIITIGLAPSWDITCYGRNIDWGSHQCIENQTIIPAGKAFNISRGLAWMGMHNIAAGLWGEVDFAKFKSYSDSQWPIISINMTVVPGETRKNVTIVDMAAKKEIHLRDKTKLYSKAAFKQLEYDISKIVKMGSICVFSGAMPDEEYIGDVLEIIKQCHDSGAKIVLDTSGPALKLLIDSGLIWLVKPNILELNTLFSTEIKDNSEGLIQAGREILDKTENVIISRGEKGAMLINKDGAWQGRAIDSREVLATVGCGDYLLGGFIKGWSESGKEEESLAQAIKIATGKAWGITQNTEYTNVMKEVQVSIEKISC